MNKRAIWMLILLAGAVVGVIIYTQQKITTGLNTRSYPSDSTTQTTDTNTQRILDSLNRAHDEIELQKKKLEDKISH